MEPDVFEPMNSVPACASARPVLSRTLAVAATCAGVVAALLAWLASRSDFFPIDLTISRIVQAAPLDWLGVPLGALNAIGFAPMVAITYGAVVVTLFAIGWKWEAAVAGFTVLGSAGVSHLVKAIVDRPRPSMQLVHVDHQLTHNSSFPAGHVVNFTALAGFLCYVACIRLAPSRFRTLLLAILVTLIGLMGLARIRAGEHWPSDVLGGYLVGIVWLTVSVVFYRWGSRWIPRRSSPLRRRGSSRGARRTRHVLLMLPVTGMLLGPAGGAFAEARFGDSSWVAPGVPTLDDSTSGGARVAPSDHERRWETALRMPFRIAFFPLRLVALGLEASATRFGDGIYARRLQPPARPGLRFSPSIDIGGVTDLGVGPALTWVGFPIAEAKLSMSGTWSNRDRRRARLREAIHDRKTLGLLLTVNYDLKPDRRYSGIGNATPPTDVSYFLLESTDAEAALHFGASPLRQLRLMGGYSTMSPRRGYNGTPLLESVFPTDVPYNHATSREMLYGVGGDLAVLDDPRDPSLGVHGRFELRHAAGLRDRDPDYNLWLLEGRAYLPVFAKRRVIAVRCVYTGVEPTGGTEVLPFYRLARSDGTIRFAGYATDRFRDRQLAIARIEYRWPLLHTVDAVALYELGEVASRAAGFTLAAAHKSYGGGLRLGMSDKAAFRVEVAKSAEGLESMLRLTSDF